MSKKMILILAALFLVVGSAKADVITLKNGDHISGEVLENGAEVLKVKHETLGEIVIKKENVETILTAQEVQSKLDAEQKAQADAIEAARAQAIAETKDALAKAQAPAAPAPAPAPVEPKVKYWDHKLSVGYATTNGNTKTSSGNLALDSHYKKDKNEWSVKSTLNYASDKGRMTTQKFFSKAENAYRFEGTKWFNNRSIEVNHDKYSFIDYRILPAFGFGYWFWEGDNSKSKFDLAAGYEYTKYNTGAKATGNATIIPHYFIDKVLVGKLKFAQDLTFYPSLDSLQDYRFRSESSLVNPLTDTLSWKLSLVDEFNSTPKSNAKKNDTTFMSAVEYAF